MSIKAFGGSPYMRRAAVEFGVVPADVHWTDAPTPEEICDGVAIGKPRFDRRLGAAVVPRITAVPVFRGRSALGVPETYEQFLARLQAFERYALSEVDIEQARALAWEDAAATVIVSRHDSLITYLKVSGLVPPLVAVHHSYENVGDGIRVAAGPVSLGWIAEHGVLNIAVDLAMPRELRDTNRDLTPAEYGACDPRTLAYTARALPGTPIA
jgi:hypothetical protein